MVGRRYLETGADGIAASALLDQVLPRGVRSRPEAEIRSCLLTRIRRDFVSGTTVEVEGWVLSVTEARLCALVALAARRV